MADFNVEVIVDPTKAVRGSRQAIKSLGQIESASDRLRNSLRNTFAGIGVGVLIAQVVQLTDTYTNLQNRIRVVTNGQMELVAATEELFAISQRTRSSFEGTVELYSRLALAGRDLGVSMRDLTQFTESMNKAIILSGASGREANAGLIQLSQGIASGALRGDELRSVLEQLPVVADVIAKQMKVTRGELRELGATGAITADVIIDAFKNAREELADRFAKTVPTISQSFQVLRNSLVKTIGAFNNSNGAARLFSRTLIAMSNEMEFLLRSASALAITIGITLAANAIPKLIVAIKSLTAAMASNPFGLLLVVLAGIIGLLISFGDQIELQQGKLATFRDFAIVVWQRITSAVAVFINWFQDNFGFIGDFASDVFDGMSFSLAGFVRSAAQNLDQLVGMWIGAYKAILVVWNNFPTAIEAIFRLAMDNAISRAEKGLNTLLILTKRVLDTLNIANQIAEISFVRLGESADSGVRATGEALKEAFEEGFNFKFFQEGVETLLNDAEKLALTRKKAIVPEVSDALLGEARARTELGLTFASILKGLDQEIALLKLSFREREIQEGILKIEKKLKRELTTAEDELAEARLRSIQSLTLQNELYEQIHGPIDEYKESLVALNALLVQGKISQEELNLAMQQTQLGGALQGLRTDLAQGDEGEMMALETQLAERNVILQQAREANLINEQEYLDLSLQANKAYNQSVIDVEDKRLSSQLNASSSLFKSLSTLTKGFVGDQGSAYKALFAVSKAFSIADTSVQIANALGKAANNPWPINLAAMAQVASLTAGLVGTISGTQFAGGFKTGGDFTVGGSGPADSQMVAFKATPGEQVSIRTPAQARGEEPNGQGGGMVLEQTIINTIDPDTVMEEASDDVFINKMERNQDAMRNIVSG